MITDSETIYNETVSNSGLNATPPAPSRTSGSKNIVTLPQSVANYLGFEFPVNTFFASNFTGILSADKLFKGTLSNSSFLVLLDNLPIDSYDGFIGQRSNILAVVPKEDKSSDHVVEYEPNNINFIKINNKTKISLRNVDARIIRVDRFAPEMNGLSVITLLVRDPQE